MPEARISQADLLTAISPLLLAGMPFQISVNNVSAGILEKAGFKLQRQSLFGLESPKFLADTTMWRDEQTGDWVFRQDNLEPSIGEK